MFYTLIILNGAYFETGSRIAQAGHPQLLFLLLTTWGL